MFNMTIANVKSGLRFSSKLVQFGMILLPNGEQAVVAIEKLRDYCLNPQHPLGKHKARVFASTLGMTAEDAPRLREVLLAAAQTHSVLMAEQDEYGQRYVLDVILAGLLGPVTVRSVWIVRHLEDVPTLVTCYVQ